MAKAKRSVTHRYDGTTAVVRLGDGIAWMNAQKPRSIHAIVTDPPYGFREFTSREQAKLRSGRGGVWRIPPRLGGHARRPVPRFTVLNDRDLAELEALLVAFADAAMRVLVPGAHVFVASNPLVSHLVHAAFLRAGFEKRGEIIRLVQTLRGGDRPKNAHREFAGVTVLPRSRFEPWALLRKPCEGRVEDNLRRFQTGALRRPSDDAPFADVIRSAPTRAAERALSPHPSLKPQAFMRAIVHAALPLGRGVILDPFLGGGSTVAAALAVGYRSIGIEKDPAYFALANRGIGRLCRLKT